MIERAQGNEMSGIFYDPGRKQLHRVSGAPGAGWLLVTHDLDASANRCRRIMREWVTRDELLSIDWHIAAHGQVRRLA
jgi:hypothetical protein